MGDFIFSPRYLLFNIYLWNILIKSYNYYNLADYTPVCTTELGRAANYFPKFVERGVKLIALSVDNLEAHKGWIEVSGWINICNIFFK